MPEAGSDKIPPTPEPLPGRVADSHCHLDIHDADRGDRLSIGEALERAAQVGVEGIVQIGCDLEGARETLEAVHTYDNLLGGVAIHPNDAARMVAKHGNSALDAALAEIEVIASDPLIRAVGETGLDYFRTGPEGRDTQRASFRAHIDMARRLGKALVIHDRDAHEDVIAVLDDEAAGAGLPERVVFHCFSGDAAMARLCGERGWYVSFAGVVTFGNATDLREAAAVAHPDLMLVETDAPYLTPKPYRGRTNGSYLMPYTVRALAELRGEDLGSLCERLWRNTETAFGPFRTSL